MLQHAGPLAAALGPLSSCGVWIFSSLVVVRGFFSSLVVAQVPERVGSVVCDTQGSLVEAHELSSTWA